MSHLTMHFDVVKPLGCKYMRNNLVSQFLVHFFQIGKTG